MTSTTRAGGRASLFERSIVTGIAGVILTPLACLTVFGIGLLLLPLLLLHAFVLMKLWAWFVAPTFGLPLLPFAAAAGIMLIVRLVSPKTPFRKKDTLESDTGTNVSLAIVLPLYILMMGWFVHWVF